MRKKSELYEYYAYGDIILYGNQFCVAKQGKLPIFSQPNGEYYAHGDTILYGKQFCIAKSAEVLCRHVGKHYADRLLWVAMVEFISQITLSLT